MNFFIKLKPILIFERKIFFTDSFLRKPILIFGRKDVFHGFVFKEISYILDIEYVTKSVFSWIHFKMDFLENLIRLFVAQVVIVTAKRKPKKTKDQEDNKRKREEKTRESEK